MVHRLLKSLCIFNYYYYYVQHVTKLLRPFIIQSPIHTCILLSSNTIKHPFEITNCAKTDQTNSNLMSSFTDLNLIPSRSNNGTAQIPDLNSDTGKQDCPPKSSFSDISYSCTSIRSRAISGTRKGKVNSSFQTGVQLSSIGFVFFIMESAGTPAIPTC